MDMAAPDASQGPVLESGTSRNDALNLHARLAFEASGPFRRAGRQDRYVRIGHGASVQSGRNVADISVTASGHSSSGDPVSLPPSRADSLVCIAHSWKIIDQAVDAGIDGCMERSMVRRLGTSGIAF
jgi:hypothetical protein